MIATAKSQYSNPSAGYLHAKFVELLPSIQKQARVAFRNEPLEQREELIAEVVANCWAAFIRLMERGQEDVVYATQLAQFAIKQVRSGRKVGAQLNVRDITGKHCQLVKGVRVERLDGFDNDAQEWREILLEDRRAGPAEIAARRIDFADWLRFLPARRRRIAKLLATGESTGEAARQFGVSHGRISQVRRELFNAWRHFQGEDTVTNQTAAVTV